MPRFTPDFLDELKSRLRPSDVIGRYVKLKKQGNEWAGLSPFSKEKTPSFFVNDQKGFFHCFSSGKHGDIIGFLQETQNLQFHEAVEMLAGDAGLEIPRDNPADARREEAKKGLMAACDEAAKFFAQMLRRSDGRKAVDYIRSRELKKSQIEEFQIGYAPADRHALKNALINKGFHEDILIEAGLVIKPDSGHSYDKFRDRLMFPILNPRGQVIAFGGRALNPDARAKYMNSPETPLFHKGSVLYRYAEARKASVTDKAPLIVCEGYMDVIALWGAGVKRAVAPLGTALTENQLAMLWRANDEPVLCFDGDKAGTGAAYRSIERALPMLKPAKSLSFVFLPSGMDPDDLLRAQGRHAFDEVLAAAKPFVDVLWQREEAAHDLTTPERRAAFRSSLRALIKTIADRDVRDAYDKEVANRLDQFFGHGHQGQGVAGGNGAQSGNYQGQNPYNRDYRPNYKAGAGSRRWGYKPPARMSPELKQKQTHKNKAIGESWRREATLLLAILHHPTLIERRENEIFSLDLTDSALSALLSDILMLFSEDPTLDFDGLKRHLSNKVSGNILEQLLNDRALNSQKFLQTDASMDEVEWGFGNALDIHGYETSLKEDLTRTASQIFQDDQDLTTRQQDSGDIYDQDGSVDAISHTNYGVMLDDGAPENGLETDLENDEAAQQYSQHDIHHDDAPPSTVDKDVVDKGDGDKDKIGADAKRLKGDEYWKASAAAREELINRNKASSKNNEGEEASSDRFNTALDKLKKSVSNTRRKN